MRIAILGAGRVGTALGDGWKRAGHDVTYTDRDAEVMVLAIPGSAVPSIVAQASGKIVLDCTNGAPPVTWPRNTRVVKIFNTIGFEHMANPRFGAEAPTMFYVGDDADAKATAARLASDLGFDAVDAGPMENAHYLDTLARFWMTLAKTMGRGIAFRLLRH